MFALISSSSESLQWGGLRGISEFEIKMDGICRRVMKTRYIYILGVLLVLGAGLFFAKSALQDVGEVSEIAPPVFQPLEEPVSPMVPEVAPPVEYCAVEEPVEIQMPVQPLEDRGDAMLFEIEALAGTPFDQAITMPFD